MRDQPTCECHLQPACVHRSGGSNLVEPEGHDPQMQWDWHCGRRPEGCEGYSVVLIVHDSWLDRETREWLERLRSEPIDWGQ